ncbi:hypothetical protein KSP39_PZI007586 [Platanthera zijinensis]|uniref:Uncharacterized protein n=1 Tax=Platanthera zijinensis TaxID=2320716 RepID=A0AAP0G949_9ASPA
MDAHHASLGRRTLEEIRLKRAAERMNTTSSSSDLEFSNQYGIQNSVTGDHAMERDSYALLSQVKELQYKYADSQIENQKLLAKLKEKETENSSLLKHLNDLEIALPSLRKSLKDVSIEKDAAIVWKEDALSQLRTTKKRLKEAEEEQYKAEEDAAALRAELNSLQRQVLENPYVSVDKAVDDVLLMQEEIAELKSLLQQESLLRKQEQGKLAEQQNHSSSLMSEKLDLEDRMAALSKKISEEASDASIPKEFFQQNKEKYEKQLHDMAVMIERLESSRQKLLMEIDSQSSEIERLFEENSNLSSSHQDALELALQWENQVNECLKQNEELRLLLDKLRSEQLHYMQPSDASALFDTEPGSSIVENSGPREEVTENLLLKERLAKEQSKTEALSAEIMKLSVELKQAIQASNTLTRLYRPVLHGIENSLMKLK